MNCFAFQKSRDGLSGSAPLPTLGGGSKWQVFIWSSEVAGSCLIAEVLLNVRTKVEVFVFWFVLISLIPKCLKV